MRRDIRVLAVSRMGRGFCVAGIHGGSGKWVRPIKGVGPVLEQDLMAEGEHLAPLDLASFDLIESQPDPPHSEDWLADYAAGVAIKRRPSDSRRLRILRSLKEASPKRVLAKKNRSLALIEPDEITFVSFDPNYFGKYDVRMGFSLDGVSYQGESKAPGYKCTDLKLRAWGRKLKTRRVLTGDELRSALGVDAIFLVVGLARWFRDDYWPMVVGFHTVPDYEGSIDFSNP